MVDTVQNNQCGAYTAETTNKMKPGTYKLACWQHNNKPLVFAAWSDNSIVKTLSNCHAPEILLTGKGVNQERRSKDWRRERILTEVLCPAQMKYYCKTFHLTDKGNGRERPYGVGGKSWKHNWLLKIFFCLINMMMANKYRVYWALVMERTPDCQCLLMKEAIKELTFSLVQRGSSMRTREALHPRSGMDLSKILGWTCGNKVRPDAKRQVVVEEGYCRETWSEYCVLARMQKKMPWGQR
jgi:hypothetical protein